MGQGPSSLPSSLPNYALHCLRVAPSSPAHGQVEPFFDYLVGVERDHPNVQESEDGLSPVELGRVLEDNEGKRIVLKVYNAKSQRIRGVSHYSQRRVDAGAQIVCSQMCSWYRVGRGWKRP